MSTAAWPELESMLGMGSGSVGADGNSSAADDPWHALRSSVGLDDPSQWEDDPRSPIIERRLRSDGTYEHRPKATHVSASALASTEKDVELQQPLSPDASPTDVKRRELANISAHGDIGHTDVEGAPKHGFFEFHSRPQMSADEAYLTDSVANASWGMAAGGLERLGLVEPGTRAALRENQAESLDRYLTVHPEGGLGRAAMLAGGEMLAGLGGPLAAAGPGTAALASKGALAAGATPAVSRLVGVAGGTAEGVGQAWLDAVDLPTSERAKAMAISGGLGGMIILHGVGSAEPSTAAPEYHPDPRDVRMGLRTPTMADGLDLAAKSLTIGEERLATARRLGADDIAVTTPDESPLSTIANLGTETLDKYKSERSALESTIDLKMQMAAEQGRALTPDVVETVKTNALRKFDDGWHARVAEAARHVDDVTLRNLADDTEPPPVPSKAPPIPITQLRPAEAGHISLPSRRTMPAATDPMSSVIAWGNAPKEPVVIRLRRMADRWVNEMSDKDEPIIRPLRRAGLTAEAKQLEMQIGRARGSARIAQMGIWNGVRSWDQVKQISTRIHDSLHSIIGGLDGQEYRDLNNYMAARRHMDDLARRDTARLEFDMAKGRQLEEMRQARLADKTSLRSVAGDIRDKVAEQLRAGRSEAKAAGSYRAFLTGEGRLQRAGSPRSLLTPVERSTDTAAGALGRGIQDVAATADPRQAIRLAQRVGMGIRDDAVSFRKRFPPIEMHPDGNLKIDDRGTALAQQMLVDLGKRYGNVADPTTGATHVARLNDLAKQIRSWSVAAVIDQLDSMGYFKPGEKEALLAKGGEYASFMRMIENIANDPNIGAPSTGTSGKPIKYLGGGLSPDHPIAPPLEGFIAQVYRTTPWVERQRTNNILGDFATAHPDLLPDIHEVAPGTARAGETFTVFRDGVRKQYTAPSELLRAVNKMTPTQVGYFTQAAVFAARTLRAGATLTPDFAVRNFLRDQATAGAYGAEFKYRPFADFATGLWAQTPWASKELRDYFHSWEASGAALSDIISSERPNVRYTAEAVAGLVRMGDKYYKVPVASRAIAKFKAEQNIFAKAFFPILYPLESVSSAVEQGTRIGSYRRAKLGGATDLEAGHYSRNITLDFGRSGSLAQKYNSVEAFSNAALQDVARFSKAVRDPKTRTAALASAFAYITIPALANYFGNKDDPDYQSLPEFERANFYHVKKMEDGRWIRIPRPQGMLNAVFGYGVQKMLEGADDKLQHPINEMLSVFFNETPLRYSPVQPSTGPAGGFHGSVEAIPNIGQPLAEVAMGEGGFSSYRQAPIVPKGLQDGMLPEDRAADTTTSTARAVGRVLGTSPLKIDYLIRGYGAGMGQQLLQGAEKLAGAGQGPTGDLPELPSTAKDIPMVGGLVSSSPYGFASQPVTDFYELEKAANDAAGSLKIALDQKRAFDAARISRQHPEAGIAAELVITRGILKDIRDQRREARRKVGMTPENRVEALLQLDQRATQIAAARMHWASDYLRGMRARQ